MVIPSLERNGTLWYDILLHWIRKLTKRKTIKAWKLWFVWHYKNLHNCKVISENVLYEIHRNSSNIQGILCTLKARKYEITIFLYFVFLHIPNNLNKLKIDILTFYNGFYWPSEYVDLMYRVISFYNHSYNVLTSNRNQAIILVSNEKIHTL